jgi:DNA mismatch repair ATPase MutL
VLSRYFEEETGYKGEFERGELTNVSEFPLDQGTCISVKDIFFDNRVRRDSINQSNEAQAIFEIVLNYALQYPHVNFICKKLDGGVIQFNTAFIPRTPDTPLSQ